MVQQLSRDKEQANQQYQTYVQHLNTEVTNLNDKNGELTEECSKLQERERQFVEHISGLEKEIQKSISRQDQIKESQVRLTKFKRISSCKEKPLPVDAALSTVLLVLLSGIFCNWCYLFQVFTHFPKF